MSSPPVGRIADQPIIARVRLLILLIGAVILLALAVGYVSHPAGKPAGPNVPANVTTLGGPT